MTMYLENKAIAPNQVFSELQRLHDSVNDPWYDFRYNLKTDSDEYSIDAHGIVRDRGRFYGVHWIICQYWYLSLDGTATDAYDEFERSVSVYKLQPWESKTLGYESLVIGLYTTEDGFLGWYYTEDPNATEDSFAAEIMAFADNGYNHDLD